MKKISIILILAILSGNLFAKSEKTKEKETLINRRVLILDFVNTQNSEDYVYLEQSIPDAFMDPLDKTKSFELLSRSLWKQLRKKFNYKKEDAYDQEKAINAGQLAPADVVVMGSFAVIGDKMQINARAIEMSSERVMVSRSVVTPISGNMFNAINYLASDMAREMKEKLPPLPQRVLVKDRVKYVKGNGLVDTGGIIWRTALLPGWGHLYSDRPRGWLYITAWAGSMGFLGYSILNELEKKTAYESAPVTSDLNTLYTDYNDAHKLTWYAIYGVIGVYSIAMLDAVFFQKKQDITNLTGPIIIPIFDGRFQGLMYRTQF